MNGSSKRPSVLSINGSLKTWEGVGYRRNFFLQIHNRSEEEMTSASRMSRNSTNRNTKEFGQSFGSVLKRKTSDSGLLYKGKPLKSGHQYTGVFSNMKELTRSSRDKSPREIKNELKTFKISDLAKGKTQARSKNELELEIGRELLNSNSRTPKPRPKPQTREDQSISLQNQESFNVSLPVLRNKPARNISESHTPFKKGIYKTLYTPRAEEKPDPNYFQRPLKKLNLLETLQRPLGTFESISQSPRSAHKSTLSYRITQNNIKSVPSTKQEIKEKSNDPIKTYPTIERLGKEVISVLQDEYLREIFEESEKKLIHKSMGSFKMMSPTLYSWLLEDFSMNDTQGATIRKELKDYLTRLATSKFSLEEAAVQENVFSKSPYEKKGASEFFSAIKEGNKAKFRDLIRVNKFLVFDFDFARMTPLHWGAKKNDTSICETLINMGADFNAKDCLGRTPLFFALKNQNVDLVRQFLLLQASPWSSPPSIAYEDICNHDNKIKNLIQKARLLHIILQFAPVKMRKQIWATDAPLYFGSRKQSDKGGNNS